MHIVVPALIRKALLKFPLNHGILVTFEGLETVAFVVRMAHPQAFVQEKLHLRLTVKAMCSSQGTWLVAVPMRFSNAALGKGRTCVFLNPRHAADYEVLQKLTTQHTFRCLFMSADDRRHISQEFSWPAGQRKRTQQMMETI